MAGSRQLARLGAYLCATLALALPFGANSASGQFFHGFGGGGFRSPGGDFGGRGGSFGLGRGYGGPTGFGPPVLIPQPGPPPFEASPVRVAPTPTSVEEPDDGETTPIRRHRPPRRGPVVNEPEPVRPTPRPTVARVKPLTPIRPAWTPTVVVARPPVFVKATPTLVSAKPPALAYAKPPTGAYAKPPTFFRQPPPPAPSFVARARPPLAETRYRQGEVLVEVPYSTPQARIDDVLRRHRLAETEAINIDLLGLSLRRWRIADARTAAAVVSELGGETALTRAQPNYLFAPADDTPTPPPVAPSQTAREPASDAAPSPAPVVSAPMASEPSPTATSAAATGAPVEASLSVEQYALIKMKVAASLESDAAAPIRVAVIDTAIDDSHPDLAGSVDQYFDAIGDGSAIVSKDHGTAMAGGIAANGRIRGVARHVKILSARAFDADGAGGPLGSTLSIVKSLDWSVKMRAQVVNMSFAGPDDPTLRDALAAASARGIVLVGAVGNAGPAASPQYPGADDHVIAATATDADDKLFSGANIGAYVAISAPGVDVLLPSAGGGYAMETGTSVSSALVAGVVALMLERQPEMKPGDIRERLRATATPLGGPAHAREFGAGLVDAEDAVRR